MATIKELETIEFIKKQKQKAKESGKDVAYVLSDGKEYFRKAINSVSTSAQITLILSIALAIIGIVVKALDYISISRYYTINYGIMIGEFIGILLITAIPALLSAKLMKLDSTPRFVLGLLILTLVFNLLFCAGIIPIVALIFNILALVSWSTYKTWFYSLKR